MKKRPDDLLNTPVVQQTSFWSRVKLNQGITSKAFDYRIPNRELYLNVGGYSCTAADFVIFLQYLNREECIAYLPYGPEVEPSEERQGPFLEELSEIIRSYIPLDCITIRYDLNWQSHWCKNEDYDSEGNWLGVPDKQYQEFQMNYGTVNWNLVKCNMDILPSNTVMVDLTVSEEEILTRMKPKTRYNIGLSLRKGIKVRTLGMSSLSVWYKLYLETAERNGLHVNDILYFESVLSARMKENSSSVQVKLLVAYDGDDPLAAMFLLISSHRATYLYGASSSSKRNLMPAYALQWEAMRQAKAFGCTEYDMFGISPVSDPTHPMYGLYKFKRGFGGEIFHQLGCWDYPLRKDKYAILQASEMNIKGYYK